MYESGNEDKINENNATIENINDSIKQKELEDLQRENQTLKQMVENRNQELNKPASVEPEKISALSNLLGINKINAAIDELNQGQNQIIGRLTEVINAVNSIAGHAPGTAPESPGDPMQKMNMLSELVGKGMEIYSTYKQNKTPENTLPALDPNWIMSEAIQSVKDDFSLGKDLRTAIKNTLKQKTVNTIIKGVVNSNTDNDDPA